MKQYTQQTRFNMFSSLVKHNRLNRIDFKIKDIDLCIVNAIRRVILSEVPTIAPGFDPYDNDKNDVAFIVNTTSLHNEFLGHRLSLIPMFFTKEEIDSYAPDAYIFSINVHNTGNEARYVTTDDITIKDAAGAQLPVEAVRRIFPHDPVTHEPVIISKVKPNLYKPENGEHLHVEFKARKGIAKEHASWCAVSLCSYQFVVDEEDAAAKLASMLEVSDDVGECDKIRKHFNTLDKFRHYKKNLTGDPSEFMFSIESECGLAPEEVFEEALEILKNKVTQLVEAEDKYAVHTINEDQNLYAINIENEDHTLGNLLQALMYSLYVKTGDTLDYVGYNMPHPLEQRIVLKVKTKDAADIPEFLSKVATHVRTLLDDIQRSWVGVAKNQKGTPSQEQKAVVRRVKPIRRVKAK